jgi:aryl-alcohol dehydrogenase
VAIVGAGAVGLAAVMASKILGCTEILAADINPQRLAVARDLGATAVAELDPTASPQQWQEQIGVRTHMVDTTGAPELINVQIRCLEAEGTLGLVSAAQPLLISPRDLARRKLTLLVEGNANPQTFIPELIDHWRQGRLPIEKLIRSYALSDINQAEADASNGQTIKPVLLPNGARRSGHEI